MHFSSEDLFWEFSKELRMRMYILRSNYSANWNQEKWKKWEFLTTLFLKFFSKKENFREEEIFLLRTQNWLCQNFSLPDFSRHEWRIIQEVFFLLLLFFRKEAFGFCTFWGLIWFLLFGSFFEWFFSSTFNIQASIFWLFQLLYEFSIFIWKKLSWIALSVLKFSTLWKLIFLNEEISILFSDWMKIAGFRKGWEI